MANEKTSLAALKGRLPGLSAKAEGEARPAERSVRFTVDLPESAHLWLKRQALEGRVSMSDVMRAAVALMQDSDELTAVVIREARKL